MKMMGLVGLTFVGILGLCSPSLASQCNFPPSLWCSSIDIARQCQVEYQCNNLKQPMNQEEAVPVNFTLYYETLCPDCKVFTKNSLFPVFKKVGHILNLVLVPYGNADENWDGKKWVFQCQHGPEECTGNLIQTCAIHIVQNISVYFPFIHCMEISDDMPEVSGKQCAKKFGIDFNAVQKCVTGPLGNQLEHQMAVKTDALQPTHTYVPWVTLNGVHNEQIQAEASKNLLKLICDTYKGPKPAACEESPAPVCERKRVVRPSE